MPQPSIPDAWHHGSPYEQYIGRWSRLVAPLFLAWLARPAGLRWLDVGCGTGALSAAILDECAPGELVGVEPSGGFVSLAARQLGDRAGFVLGSADALPFADGSRDVAVAGLVLNFLPDLPAALAEMARVVVPGGTVAAYVWDYAGDMEIVRRFWDAAASLDPAAEILHEGRRFPLCTPENLRTAFARAGLANIEATSLDRLASFADFDDYWQPFLGGQGPAPAYVASLDEARREALRARLRATLAADAGGRIDLRIRAWAVRGVVERAD